MAKRKEFLVINGPNLNLLGKRKPGTYGTQTLYQINRWLSEEALKFDCDLETKQSNYEGELIGWIQNTFLHSHLHQDGIILNAGGYTHTSVALHDAVEAAAERGVPTVEVHLSNIYAREHFRRRSLLKKVCIASVVGHGKEGYLMAVGKLIDYLDKK